MNQEELTNIFKAITAANISDKQKDEAITTVLNLASQAFTKDVMQSLLAVKDNPAELKPAEKRKKAKKQEDIGVLTFKKKELETMPKSFQNAFIADNRIVKYRYYEGLYQARYRRDGYNIEVASKDFDTMKRKFIERLTGHAEPQKKNTGVKFAEFAEEWLKIKQQTTKPSTFKEYERMYNTSIKPVFGNYYLTAITRSMVQDFLFGYVNEGKHRTAEKLQLQLNCIFDMAMEDYNIPTPMKKIVLPFHESKKGSALTLDEEKKLIDFCITHRENEASSALLVLLYFGLRRSELKSITTDGNSLTCVTSKQKLGRNEVERTIPFTPVFKRVLPYVDFEKAKNTNVNTIYTTFKRLFPKHHTHELRYTFITRVKQCKVDPEIVMKWAGHSEDKDVLTSRVNRGYTDFSENYILAEADKVNYSIGKVA